MDEQDGLEYATLCSRCFRCTDFAVWINGAWYCDSCAVVVRLLEDTE
jgi:late competence protein required for DNA uptake (superfamily II DNA/RNA helicase)